MKLFESEEAVEGRHYAAVKCDGTIGLYLAERVMNGVLMFAPVSKIGWPTPIDVFNYWTSDLKQLPALAEKYEVEKQKVERILEARREKAKRKGK